MWSSSALVCESLRCGKWEEQNAARLGMTPGGRRFLVPETLARIAAILCPHFAHNLPKIGQIRAGLDTSQNRQKPREQAEHSGFTQNQKSPPSGIRTHTASLWKPREQAEHEAPRTLFAHILPTKF